MITFEPEKHKLLGNTIEFLSNLINFDEDNNIAESVMINKIEPYIVELNLTPEHVAVSSIAFVAICMWVRAIYEYHHVALPVEPKTDPAR